MRSYLRLNLRWMLQDVYPVQTSLYATQSTITAFSKNLEASLNVIFHSHASPHPTPQKNVVPMVDKYEVLWLFLKGWMWWQTVVFVRFWMWLTLFSDTNWYPDRVVLPAVIETACMSCRRSSAVRPIMILCVHWCLILCLSQTVARSLVDLLQVAWN